jgi:hypothetical protein
MKAKVSSAARALAIVLAAALAGCGATKYGEMGLTGGYTDKIVEPDIAAVEVGGNGRTPPEKVKAMVELRAAELTLQQGYRRFSLFTVEDQAATEALKENRLGPYLREKAAHEGGAVALMSRTMTYYYNGVPTGGFTRYSGELYVVMTKDRARGAYDAAKVVAELRPRLVPPESEAPVHAQAQARDQQ